MSTPEQLAAAQVLQKNGIDLIAAERQRQLSVERWTPSHDDAEHRDGSLALAGSCYAVVAQCLSIGLRFEQASEIGYGQPRQRWPWGYSWWKPSDDPIRNLEKAGALIAAEIDRLLRLKAGKGKSVAMGDSSSARGASSENPSVSEPKELEEKQNE